MRTEQGYSSTSVKVLFKVYVCVCGVCVCVVCVCCVCVCVWVGGCVGVWVCILWFICGICTFS